MGLSHAIVSRHLSSLEERLGVLLLNRQSGLLTDTGVAYHRRISAAIAEIGSASEAIVGARSDTLSIWSSAGFSVQWLARRLSGFNQGQDRRVIDLRASDQEPNFAAGEADGDVRYQYDWSPSQPAHVRSEEIARPLVFPVVSPGFAKTVGAAAEIVRLPLIQESSDREWRQWLKAQGVATDDLPAPVARYGQAHLCLAAARAGQGVALANSILAAEDFSEGRLIRLEPRGGPFNDIALGAYAFRSLRARWRDPLLSRFRNWLRQSVTYELANREHMEGNRHECSARVGPSGASSRRGVASAGRI